MTPVDAVIIGRNEGDRLLACLDSLRGDVRRLIYVDSGSTDGSVAAAHARGAEVVELDPTLPFTAARARNAGLARLDDDTAFVQLVDGDCAVRDGWITTARDFLETSPQVAVVCIGAAATSIVAASVGVWFVLDTGISLILGFVGHAAFNVAFVALLVPAVLAARKTGRSGIGDASTPA